MPRNGSDVYSVPSGSAAVTGTAISSTAFNTLISDLETDLNTDRPIVAGGTGASTAAQALANLGGQPLDATLTALAALVFSSSNAYLRATGADTFTVDTAAEHLAALGSTEPVDTCAFSAYRSAQVNNVTGDNTEYTVVFDTELYDVGSDYNNSTGVFTAPEDGIYQFHAKIGLFGLTSSHTQMIVEFTYSGSSYSLGDFNLNSYAIAAGGTSLAVPISVALKMTSGQTMSVSVNVLGGAKVVDVGGASELRYYFTGYLVG